MYEAEETAVGAPITCSHFFSVFIIWLVSTLPNFSQQHFGLLHCLQMIYIEIFFTRRCLKGNTKTTTAPPLKMYLIIVKNINWRHHSTSALFTVVCLKMGRSYLNKKLRFPHENADTHTITQSLTRSLTPIAYNVFWLFHLRWRDQYFWHLVRSRKWCCRGNPALKKCRLLWCQKSKKFLFVAGFCIKYAFGGK